jgi:hypothetical protein
LSEAEENLLVSSHDTPERSKTISSLVFCSAEAAVDGTDEKNEETEGTLLKQEKQCC